MGEPQVEEVSADFARRWWKSLMANAVALVEDAHALAWLISPPQSGKAGHPKWPAFRAIHDATANVERSAAEGQLERLRSVDERSRLFDAGQWSTWNPG